MVQGPKKGPGSPIIQRSLTSYHHHPLLLLYTFPSHSPFALSFICVHSIILLVCRAFAPDMVPSSGPPPGLSRPKSSSSSSAKTSQSITLPHILSPVPSQPRTSWFQLLAPSPSPAPSLPPATAASIAPVSSRPHVDNVAPMSHPSPPYVDNDNLITNLSTSGVPGPSTTDPWTHAHLRICAHALADCSACSIALVCCSCCALRFTPGPPPVSPAVPAQRSRSASPSLFRDIGNGSPPLGFDNSDDYPPHDDDAYARALAECDTCDNSSCPRGLDEPATYTIVVEQFDESLEELYDCTFRTCNACNRSCKKTFLGHRIKSRTFDNSAREALNDNSSKESSTKPKPVVTKLGAAPSTVTPVAVSLMVAPESWTFTAPDNTTYMPDGLCTAGYASGSVLSC